MTELENYLRGYYEEECIKHLIEHGITIKLEFTKTAEVCETEITFDSEMDEEFEVLELRMGSSDIIHRVCPKCEYIMLFKSGTNILTCDSEDCEYYGQEVYDYDKK